MNSIKNLHTLLTASLMFAAGASAKPVTVFIMTAGWLNMDRDGYDNLIEYAFDLPPDSGAGTPFSINPSCVSLAAITLSFFVFFFASTSKMAPLLHFRPATSGPLCT